MMMKVNLKKIVKVILFIPFMVNSFQTERLSVQIITNFNLLKVHTEEGFVKGYTSTSQKIAIDFKRISLEVGIKQFTKKYFAFETKKLWENQIALKCTLKFLKYWGFSLWGGYTFRKSPTYFLMTFKILSFTLTAPVAYLPPKESRWIGGGIVWNNKRIKVGLDFNYYTILKNSAVYRWEFLPSFFFKGKRFFLKTALYIQKFHTRNLSLGFNSSKAFLNFRIGKVLRSQKFIFSPYLFIGFGEKTIYSQDIFIKDDLNSSVKREIGGGFVLRKNKFFIKWEISSQKLKMINVVKTVNTFQLIFENKSAVATSLSLGFFF